MNSKSALPVEVFISYSHRDEKFRDDLQRHLSGLQRQKLVAIWHDRRIDAGQEWRHEIDEHLAQARIVLLLISADFLASDYCWGVEMKQALELHESGQATVIPIILRPVDWTGAPFGRLQALPESAKPITKWQDRDEAFASVARGVRRAVEALSDSRSGADLESGTTRRVRSPLPTDSDTFGSSYVSIAFSMGDVLTFSSDILIVKYAQAFHGVDRIVAHILAQNAENLAEFQVPLGEYRVVGTRDRIKPKEVLFVGVQPLVYLDYSAIERFSITGLAALRQEQSNARSVSVTLHGPGYGLDEREALHALLKGLIIGVAQRNCPSGLERITIVEKDEKRFARIPNHLRTFDIGMFKDGAELLPQNILRIRMGGIAVDTKSMVEKRRADRGGERHSLFVAMPYSEEFDDIYHYAIESAAHASGLLCERVDAIAFTADVVERIKRGIERADLVVADLTSGNANVYLEVSDAWGCRTPTILVVRNVDDLKFDVKTQRCLVYKNIRELERLLMAEITQLKNQLSG
jgi:TIR domain